MKVLWAMCGSSGIGLAPLYAMEFRRAFGDVNLRVIMSGAAQAMFPPSAMATFANIEDEPVGHIEVAAWCDAFVVLPCTANFLGKAASGICDTDPTLVFAAQPKKSILFPNMNERMWRSSIVQDNVSGLLQAGVDIVEPEHTEMFETTTGQVAMGRVMPDPGSCAEYIRRVAATGRGRTTA